MRKLGVFVGERGLWTFFREIYEDLSAHYRTNVFVPKEYHLPVLSGRINRWAYSNGIRNILKTSDVCFFEWASELLQVATQMPKYSPIIARLHSFELAEWADRINWDHVDKIIFVSEAMRKRFLAQYPAQSPKTVVVHNSISVSRFPPGQHMFDFSLGMLCSIQPIKRVYEIILVVRELCEQGYRPSLHIGGAPSQDNPHDRYYVAARGLVEKLGLQETVKFHGKIEDSSAWLQNIDIFISNSFWEGMQTALLEAMASGCYCLAHSWDGVEEALPAENIYTTDTELKRKLIGYLLLPEAERTRRKNQTMEIAKRKFDLEGKKVQIREIIESVLKDNASLATNQGRYLLRE